MRAGSADDPVAESSGLIRLTVVASGRREDLALSADVAVAELVPVLAARLRVLSRATAGRGARLVTPDGCPLEPERSLREQGVADGALLVLDRPPADDPPPAYDDPAEAVAQVVDDELPVWTESMGERAGVAVAGILLAVGLAGVAPLSGSRAATIGCAAVTVLLMAVAAAGSRRSARPAACLTAGWGAAAYAAVTGWLWARQLAGWPVAVAVAGGAGAAAGLGLLLGSRGRSHLLGPALAGLVVGLAGTAAALAAPTAAVLVGCQVLAVGLGGLGPRMVAAFTAGLGVRTPPGAGDLGAPTDLREVSRRTASAHRLLLDVWAAAGLILLFTTPPLVATGPWGAALAAVASTSLLLAARRHRSAAAVLTGVGAGATGLLVAAGAVLVLLPDARVVVAAAIPATAVLLLALPARSVPAVLRARIADLAEVAVWVALPPLAVLAAGGVPAARG